MGFVGGAEIFGKEIQDEERHLFTEEPMTSYQQVAFAHNSK